MAKFDRTLSVADPQKVRLASAEAWMTREGDSLLSPDMAALIARCLLHGLLPASPRRPGFICMPAQCEGEKMGVARAGRSTGTTYIDVCAVQLRSRCDPHCLVTTYKVPLLGALCPSETRGSPVEPRRYKARNAQLHLRKTTRIFRFDPRHCPFNDFMAGILASRRGGATRCVHRLPPNLASLEHPFQNIGIPDLLQGRSTNSQ